MARAEGDAMSNIASFARIDGQVRTREHVEFTDLDEFNRILAARAEDRVERLMAALRGDMDTQARSIRDQLRAFGLPETTEAKTTLDVPIVRGPVLPENMTETLRRVREMRGNP